MPIQCGPAVGSGYVEDAGGLQACHRTLVEKRREADNELPSRSSSVAKLVLIDRQVIFMVDDLKSIRIPLNRKQHNRHNKPVG